MRPYLEIPWNILASRGNRGSRARSLVRAIRWFIHCKTGGGSMIQPIFTDRLINCHPNGFASRSIMLFGEWAEYDSLNFIREFLRPSDTFLDVGANVGLFSLLASETLPPESIICIEPGEIQRRHLIENLKLNKLVGISIHTVAAGASNLTTTLTKADSTSHLAASGCADEAKPTEPVEVRSLDSLLPETTFHLCKIDVEGYELPALRGAAGLINKGLLPVILLEINGGSDRFGISSSDTIGFLRSHGYEMGIYQHDRRSLLTTAELWDVVIAFTPAGREMIQARIAGLKIE